MLDVKDVALLKKLFVSKDDLRKELIKLDNKAEERFSKIFNLIDPLAKEIHDGRESRAIFSYRIEDLEKRVKALEE